MGNLLSLQRYIQGDNSGNTNSYNTVGSFNTYNQYYNYGGRSARENHSEILQHLYPPGSGYRSHRSRVPEPVLGTCTWVPEHPKYKQWLENKTSGLLWLSADPGCGKSVIASFLVGHLEAQTDAIICYFFFKDDSEEQRSATFALRAILHQLIGQRITLCRYAEEEFERKGKRFMEEVDTLWDILVKAVAEGQCGEVICVIDALDECEEKTLTPLIRHITRLRGSRTSGTPLKFLVTSRPYHSIEIELGSPDTTIRLKGEEEINAITADVNRLIDGGIKKLESHWGQTGRLDYLRNLLMSSADRTFLWVSLVLEVLNASGDGSREEFTKIVSTTPHNLAQFYIKILDKSPDPDKARRILNIVVAAVRPLTLREMNVAFGIRRDRTTIEDLGDISYGFEKTVKNLCGLFVRIIDSKIYLVHQTAREFLIGLSSPDQGNWQHTLRFIDSDFIMADICINYLALEDFESNPMAMDDRYDSGSMEYPLLDYAASHWVNHFRYSGARQMELFDRTKKICERGSRRFLAWLKVYWENSGQYLPFPNDFTHLMIASWLGQGTVVERLLEEGGEIDARSREYGTALNIAALQSEVIATTLLVQRGAEVYIGGRGYNISGIVYDIPAT